MAFLSRLFRLTVSLVCVLHALPLWSQRGITIGQKSVPLFTEVAWFDTWVEGLPSADYSESVYADFSIVERAPERVVIERFIRDNNRHIYARYLVGAAPLILPVGDRPEAKNYPLSPYLWIKMAILGLIFVHELPLRRWTRLGDLAVSVSDQGGAIRIFWIKLSQEPCTSRVGSE